MPVSFETALSALKDGQRVQRFGWNGTGLWLKLQRPALSEDQKVAP
jgi:hypothetical protein